MSEGQVGGTDFFGKIKEIIVKNQENLLIIAFVLIIVGGVWAYMQAPSSPNTSGTASEIGAKTEEKKDSPAPSASASTETPAPAKEETKVVANTENKDTKKEETKVAVETETDTSANTTVVSNGEKMTVKAVKGDGKTHLARRALKEYLTNSGSDSSINKEQKIYIENYLAKRLAKNNIYLNDEVSFDKTNIVQAIDKAKTLTAAQLKNLEQYSAKVKSL